MHLKMVSAKCWPFCPWGDELKGAPEVHVCYESVLSDLLNAGISTCLCCDVQIIINIYYTFICIELITWILKASESLRYMYISKEDGALCIHLRNGMW